MRRRFGIVKVVRGDGTACYDIGVISYDSDPKKPCSITRDPSIFSVESNDLTTDEDTIVMRLKMMIRDCESNPVYLVNE
jgi:hypothetical protein